MLVSKNTLSGVFCLVDLGLLFWKQFARESEYLVSILKEVEVSRNTNTPLK